MMFRYMHMTRKLPTKVTTQKKQKSVHCATKVTKCICLTDIITLCNIQMYNKKKKRGKKGNRKKTVSKQPSARAATPRPRRAFRPAGKKTGVRRAHLRHGRALGTPNCQHYKKNLTRQARITWVQGTSCDKLSCHQRALPHSGFKWLKPARDIIFQNVKVFLIQVSTLQSKFVKLLQA